MPVFNAESFLDEAIESVLSQTFEDFELIACDDGSTDDSSSIPKAKADKDLRVRVLGGEHSGLTHWLNEGIRLSRGPFIARTDADDIALSARFQRQVDYLQANSNCCLVGSQPFQIDPGGWQIGRWQVPLTHAEIDSRCMRGKLGCIIRPRVMVWKSALEGVHGYQPELELVEDYDLFMRLAETGRVANLDEFLLKYRLHEKSVTVSRSSEQYRATCKALSNAWDRRSMPGEVPPVDCGKASPRHEALLWHWCYSALTEKHFKTARKYAHRLVAAQPGNTSSWLLLVASALGPVAFALRNLISFRPSRSQ